MTPSVDEIAAMPDPVLRNLWITQRYHELAIGLRDAALGQDATWCAFAVWASKTAGATIRGDELPARVRELLDGAAPAGAGHHWDSGLEADFIKAVSDTHVAGAVKTVSEQVSASIAAGNVLVFAELAPLFAALVADISGAAPEAGGTLDAALARLAGTGTDTTAVTSAFAAYRRAAGESDRATLVLAGNILAVSHEQERLQAAITDALNAAVRDVFDGAVDRDLVRHLPSLGSHHPLRHTLDEMADALEAAWQRALTATMLRLITADEALKLDDDVPPLDGTLFPSALSDLHGCEAGQAYGLWDRTDGTGRPTGAHDWADLPERMNYIATLFRSRQQHPPLFSPPFTPAQLDDLAHGRLPAPPL
ncbi:MAG TPA: hypothetical protein VGG38_02550 [Acidimicrobiales bacterium]